MRLAWSFALVLLPIACSGGQFEVGDGDLGGAATGGSIGSGGQSSGSGGVTGIEPGPGTGGGVAPPTGGTAGGVTTGGQANTGGEGTTGGSAMTGGTSSSGGASTGGDSSGGASSTGGDSSGGASTGGTSGGESCDALWERYVELRERARSCTLGGSGDPCSEVLPGDCCPVPVNKAHPDYEPAAEAYEYWQSKGCHRDVACLAVPCPADRPTCQPSSNGNYTCQYGGTSLPPVGL